MIYIFYTIMFALEHKLCEGKDSVIDKDSRVSNAVTL